jgi:hypothetical protein
MSNQRLKNEFSKSFKEAARIKECFHHKKDECAGIIKHSHSIQKNGRLSVLEGEINGNMCLYTFTSGTQSKNTMLDDLIPIGKKEASTFFGFCDYHDSKLFSIIENQSFIDSDEHCFLHSYRSFAHSYHRKKEEIRGWNNDGTEYNDYLKQIYGQELLEYKREGYKIVWDVYEEKKKILDYAIENKNFSEFEFLTYTKEGVIPIAVSSVMCPRLSYKGRLMNNADNSDLQISQPIITFLPDKDQTLVILMAFKNDKESVNLLDELNELNDFKLEKAITSLVIANCENTFMSPLFWKSLGKKGQRKLLDEFINSTFSTKNDKNFFHSRFNFFDDKYKIDKLKKSST